MTNEFILSLVLAIGEFESNNNDAAVGKDGERTRYQITRAKLEETRKRHKLTSEPWTRWTRASDPKLQFVHHQICYMIVEDTIIDRHVFSVKTIYAIYNGGYRGRNRPVVQERARRFAKLWKEKYDPKRKQRT